jgi:hypothetical protein
MLGVGRTQEGLGYPVWVKKKSEQWAVGGLGVLLLGDRVCLGYRWQWFHNIVDVLPATELYT